jgi:hypothetical protein
MADEIREVGVWLSRARGAAIPRGRRSHASETRRSNGRTRPGDAGD